MIIGLVGRINSGKGTVADTMVKVGRFVKISFADPVKDCASTAFGWERNLLEGDTDESRTFRETPCPVWSRRIGRNFTPREALQTIGTECFRDTFHNEIWIHNLMDKISKDKVSANYVIPDVRFVNEVQAIRENDGIIIFVRTPCIEPWLTDLLRDKFNTPGDIHRSEWDWATNTSYPYDIEFLNNKKDGIDVLQEQVKNLISRIEYIETM